MDIVTQGTINLGTMGPRTFVHRFRTSRHPTKTRRVTSNTRRVKELVRLPVFAIEGVITGAVSSKGDIKPCRASFLFLHYMRITESHE